MASQRGTCGFFFTGPCRLGLFCLAACWIANTASAASYRVTLIGLVGPNRNSDRVLGTYPTYEAASVAALAWAKRAPANDISMWRIDELDAANTDDSSADPVALVALAKEGLERLRQLALRARATTKATFLPVMKEYSTAIKDVWTRITSLKRTLAGQAKNLSDENYRMANELIAGFNSEAAAFNPLARSAGLAPISTITPITATAQITFQKLPFVDPGSPSRANRPMPVELPGKTFEGTFGKSKATITFENDNFTVSGDISESGKWRQIDSAITLDSDEAVYRGVIDGNSIKGIRYPRNHEPYEEWSVSAAQIRDMDNNENMFLGTWWKVDPQRGIKTSAWSITIEPNGKAVQEVHYKGHQRTGTWKRLSDTKLQYTLPRWDNPYPFEKDMPEFSAIMVFESHDRGYLAHEENGVLTRILDFGLPRK